MAIILGPVAKGNTAVAYPGSAGEVVSNRYEVIVPANAAAGDIIDFGSIPPNCRIVDAILDVGGSLGATSTNDVGIMSGDPGSTDPARTCGNEFFVAAAGTASAVTRMSNAAGFRVAPAPAERSIGLKLVTRTVPTAASVALTVLLATQ